MRKQTKPRIDNSRVKSFQFIQSLRDTNGMHRTMIIVSINAFGSVGGQDTRPKSYQTEK